jgi:tRNA (cmo5U34)-methyltransferase
MIVSALSIHYLGHEEKPVLYGKMHEALNPGGIFVHANQVEGETREQHLIYELLGWVCGLEHLFHRLS